MRKIEYIYLSLFNHPNLSSIEKNQDVSLIGKAVQGIKHSNSEVTILRKGHYIVNYSISSSTGIGSCLALILNGKVLEDSLNVLTEDNLFLQYENILFFKEGNILSIRNISDIHLNIENFSVILNINYIGSH